MRLLKVKDGLTFAYSEAALRKEFPHVSFPRGLSGVDVAQYGCLWEDGDDNYLDTVIPRVSMYQFLWAVRDYGMREQFERYTLCLDGHARDYWFTAPYVTKNHTCVKHFARYFQLDKVDLDMLFHAAASIEE